MCDCCHLELLGQWVEVGLCEFAAYSLDWLLLQGLVHSLLLLAILYPALLLPGLRCGLVPRLLTRLLWYRLLVLGLLLLVVLHLSNVTLTLDVGPVLPVLTCLLCCCCLTFCRHALCCCALHWCLLLLLLLLGLCL